MVRDLLYPELMFRDAVFLAILAISTTASAADSNTASKLHVETSSSDSVLSVLAFAIIFVTLARLLVVRDTTDG